MIRCARCNDVVTRVPHTRADASECDGAVWVVDDEGNRSRRVIWPVESQSFVIERLTETHFDIHPVPGMPPDMAVLVGADGDAAMIADIAPPLPEGKALAVPLRIPADPETSYLAPVAVLDPDRTDGALPALAPVADHTEPVVVVLVPDPEEK